MTVWNWLVLGLGGAALLAVLYSGRKGAPYGR